MTSFILSWFSMVCQSSIYVGNCLVENFTRVVLNLASSGRDEVLTPNHTVVYKSFSTQNKSINCLKPMWLFSGADFPVIRSKLALNAGNLELDIYLPKGNPGDKAVIAYIHGGGWKGGDRSIFSVNYYGGFPALLLDRGHIVVALSYRTLLVRVVDDVFKAVDVRTALLWGKWTR